MTAYDMRISDWSSDVCFSDLVGDACRRPDDFLVHHLGDVSQRLFKGAVDALGVPDAAVVDGLALATHDLADDCQRVGDNVGAVATVVPRLCRDHFFAGPEDQRTRRPAEHTSELQSLMRISYAVFC